MSEQKEEIKKEIFANGTDKYCSPIHSAQMYRDGNCPLNDVEAAISSAMDFYHERLQAQPPYNTGTPDEIESEICKHLNGLPYAGGYPHDWKETLAEHLSKHFAQLSAPNTGKGGVWVKPSDMLPPIQTPVVIKDSNGTKYIDSAYTGWDKRITDYEWLDESTSSPISVGDGWEEKFEEWVCKSWPENNNESAGCRGAARYAMEWVSDNVIRKYETQKPPSVTTK